MDICIRSGYFILRLGLYRIQFYFADTLNKNEWDLLTVPCSHVEIEWLYLVYMWSVIDRIWFSCRVWLVVPDFHVERDWSHLVSMSSVIGRTWFPCRAWLVVPGFHVERDWSFLVQWFAEPLNVRQSLLVGVNEHGRSLPRWHHNGRVFQLSRAEICTCAHTTLQPHIKWLWQAGHLIRLHSEVDHMLTLIRKCILAEQSLLKTWIFKI